MIVIAWVVLVLISIILIGGVIASIRETPELLIFPAAIGVILLFVWAASTVAESFK